MVAAHTFAMTDESPTHPQRILLVTGLLGAGKTTAMRALEDLGWEAVDNFPIRLLERLLETGPGTGRPDAGPPPTGRLDAGAPLAIQAALWRSRYRCTG